jgi:bifunctional phosphoglucose/phosphomannose isomerase
VSGDWQARLADPAALTALDPGDMLGRLTSWPALFAAARYAGLPAGWEPDAPPRRPPGRLLVGGMGGSGIASDLLAAFYAAGGSQVPAQVLPVRDYRLPPLRPGDALVLCSYSGETEEVLALLAEARRVGLAPLLITAGGRLAAAGADCPCFRVPAGHVPRAALPALFGRLLAIGAGYGLHAPAAESPAELAASLAAVAAECAPEQPLAANPGKALALALGDARPIFCALAPAWEAVALRLRSQFEENAKRAAQRRSLPELHHNSWVAWAAGDLPGLPVWLGAVAAHPRVLLRRRLSEELLAARGLRSLEIPSRGEGLLPRLLTSLLVGDTLTVYHALMRGLDPTATPALTAMKQRLADAQEPA